MAHGFKTGGRQAGTQNKMTRQLREMILEALDHQGGVAYLTRVADEQPVAFCTLLGKVLPTQLTGSNDGPVKMVFEWMKTPAISASSES